MERPRTKQVEAFGESGGGMPYGCSDVCQLHRGNLGRGTAWNLNKAMRGPRRHYRASRGVAGDMTAVAIGC